MKCGICLREINSNPYQVKEMMFGTGKSYPYYKCSSCGCLQIGEIEREVSNLYPADYYSFNTYSISYIIRRIKQLIVRYSVAKSLGEKSIFGFLLSDKNRDGGAHAIKGRSYKDAKILDVGCGDGTFIDALSWCGYQNLTGIDPFLEKDVVHKKYQLLKTDIENLAGNEVYDLIILNHSFEHVEQPIAVLKHIQRLLKMDGLCIIRIPVSDSYAFEIYKENWVQLDAPRHIYLHTNKSMEIAAAKSNLRVDAIVDDSSEFQFIGSEQYKRGISLNASNSYYVSPLKKTFLNKKHPFSRSDIKRFKKEADSLNKQGRGDQRIYYLYNI